jgi:hypothetical protein
MRGFNPVASSRSREEPCELGPDPSTKWSRSRAKPICPILGLGMSGPTDAQVDATLCGQFQEAHGLSS